MKAPNAYRKEFFKDLSYFIEIKKEKSNLFIVCDLNESIEANTIQNFMIDNGVIEAHR